MKAELIAPRRDSRLGRGGHLDVYLLADGKVELRLTDGRAVATMGADSARRLGRLLHTAAGRAHWVRTYDPGHTERLIEDPLRPLHYSLHHSLHCSLHYWCTTGVSDNSPRTPGE